MAKKTKGVQIFPASTQFMGPLDKDVPEDLPPAEVKQRVQRRIAWALYRRSLLSPFFNAKAVLSYLTSIIGLFFLFSLLGEKAATDRVSQVAVGIISAVAASTVWAVVLAIANPSRVRKEQKTVGEWIGNRFVYREPRLVFTKEWSPKDNGVYPLFEFGEAYPGALLDYRIDIDGPADRLNCVVLGAYYFSPVEPVLTSVKFDLRGRVRLRKDNQLGLACHALPDTLPAIVRVYILAWEIDPNTQLDYTDLRSQTRFVLRPPNGTVGTQNGPPENTNG